MCPDPQALERKRCWRRRHSVVFGDCQLLVVDDCHYRVDDPNSGTPLGRRMTSRKKKRDRRAEKVRWVQERIEVDNARRMATAAAAAAAAAEK